MHLGMSGSFRLAKSGEARTPGDFHHARSKDEKHDHLLFHMSSGWTVIFNDPRRFGFMKIVPRADLARDPLLRALGPEPLGNAFNAEMLAAACRGKKTSLKAALSDQKVIAGLGNIYVCEALYRERLSPKRSFPLFATFYKTRSRPAGPPCAIIARPTASWDTSSIAFASMTAKASAA
jgi:formamidopyrimidine-DNA glycosylase